jgi:hypothetical protein
MRRATLAALLGFCLLLPAAADPIAGAAAQAAASPARADAAPRCTPGSTSPWLRYPVRGFSPLVHVCIDGRGPYSLVLDTGAATSVVSPRLARALSLPRNGPIRRVAGAGCQSRYRETRVQDWKVAGRSAGGGSAIVTTVPHYRRWKPEGLLGADVLSRFGSATLEFQSRELLLGTRAASPPAFRVPLHVGHSRGSVWQTVSVQIGSGGESEWLIDSGSSLDLFDAAAARAHELEESPGPGQPYRAVCGKGRASIFESGPWSLDGNSLPAAPVYAIPSLLPRGIEGVLGLETMARFKWVGIDWEREKLNFGPHR